MTLGVCLFAFNIKREVVTMMDGEFHNESLFVGKLFYTDLRLIKVSNMTDDQQ